MQWAVIHSFADFLQVVNVYGVFPLIVYTDWMKFVQLHVSGPIV